MSGFQPRCRERRADTLWPTATDPDATLATFSTLGVCAQALTNAPRPEWRGLQAELDRFYAYGYGGATQRTFLHSPHPRLCGETPAQALRRDGGILDVRAALADTLHGLRIA